MPYIKKERRGQIDMGDKPTVAGEMNYKFTMIGMDYLKMWGKSYTRINDIIGALECAKLEFYRMLAAPYEDEKIKENGGIY